MGGWPDRWLDRNKPLASELAEGLLARLQVGASVQRGQYLGESSLRILFGAVAAVPLLAPLAGDWVAIELDDDRVAIATLDDTASHCSPAFPLIAGPRNPRSRARLTYRAAVRCCRSKWVATASVGLWLTLALYTRATSRRSASVILTLRAARAFRTSSSASTPRAISLSSS